MAVMNGNGGVLPSAEDALLSNNNNNKSKAKLNNSNGEDGNDDVSLKGVLNHLIGSIFDKKSEGINKSLLMEMFRDAIINIRGDLLLWTRHGTPLRPILLVSAGIVTVLALTGMLVFMLLFVAATVNAIVISLLISLAAVGGFLAIFFACLTAMYIGVLFVAAIVTFTVTILSIIAALVTAGWIGFIWIMWLAVSKVASLAKRSFYKQPFCI